MIITKSPLRLSIFGGGTDFPEYYTNYGGACVSLTPTLYITTIIKKRNDRKVVVNYSQREEVDHTHHLKHDIIRECLDYYDIKHGIEIHTIGDVSGYGSGLGSSGAVTTGVLKALSEYVNEPINQPDLARLATRIEMINLGRPIGLQDQTASAYGGFNLYEFQESGDTRVTKINHAQYLIDNHLMLFEVGYRGGNSKQLAKQKANIPAKIDVLTQLKDMAYEGASLAQRFMPLEFGELLQRAWDLKKTLADGVTNAQIDDMYNTAYYTGDVLGGKVCGAGGGGYMLLFIEDRESKLNVAAVMDGYRQVFFDYEPRGARVVYSE